MKVLIDIAIPGGEHGEEAEPHHDGIRVIAQAGTGTRRLQNMKSKVKGR
jgi:hypothetical protein